jgi:hypothetical protein
MRFDRTLPPEKFFNRQLVAAASFLKADRAVAYGIDNHGLTPCYPAFGIRGWQVGDAGANGRQDLVSGHTIQSRVLVHDGRVNPKTLKNP